MCCRTICGCPDPRNTVCRNWTGSFAWSEWEDVVDTLLDLDFQSRQLAGINLSSSSRLCDSAAAAHSVLDPLCCRLHFACTPERIVTAGQGSDSLVPKHSLN